MHSEGINAGEMKHGPLALVDDKLPIVVVSTMDSMHSKMAGVIQQVGCRGASRPGLRWGCRACGAAGCCCTPELQVRQLLLSAAGAPVVHSKASLLHA